MQKEMKGELFAWLFMEGGRIQDWTLSGGQKNVKDWEQEKFC